LGIMLSEFHTLIVDGYNIIHAWDDLKRAARSSLEQSRDLLVNTMADFALSHHKEVVVVFDGVKTGHWIERFPHPHVKVIFSSKGTQADVEIERIVYNSSAKNKILVATSDRMEQLTVARIGANYINAIKFQSLISGSRKSFRNKLKRYAKSERPSLGDTLKL